MTQIQGIHTNLLFKSSYKTDYLSDHLQTSYRFYIPNEEKYTKPFNSFKDRRLTRIANNTDCIVQLSNSTHLHRGQYMRMVYIIGENCMNIELCIRRIEESFPQFYALAPLEKSLSQLKEPTLKDVYRYNTKENISDGIETTVTYYKLTFFILSSQYAAYLKWCKGRVHRMIEKMNCHIVVSGKDYSDVGFVRRYAVILGLKKQKVIYAYKLFHTSFLAKYL
ncbi:unnamed protein product [Trichobilharzia szidati]|nr:unnamed protein product [Trichobilharzia szidati]